MKKDVFYINKMVLVILFTFLIGLQNSAAAAADWVRVYQSDNDYMYIDASDISPKEDYRTIFYSMKTEYTDPVKHGGFKTKIDKIEYNFQANIYRSIKSVSYHSNGTSKRYNNSEWNELNTRDPINKLNGAAFTLYLEKQQWIPVSDTLAYFNPYYDGDRYFFWIRTKLNPEYAYSCGAYYPSTHLFTDFFIASSTAQNDYNLKFVFMSIAEHGYKELNSNAPLYKVINNIIENTN